MHCNINTLLLWHDKLLTILDIMHVPKFNLSVAGGCGDLVVLVKGVVLILFFSDVEFAWRYVFEVSAVNYFVWVVAVLKP